MRKCRSLLHVAWVALTLPLVVRCGPYGHTREDEIQCEQAVARLTSCCPGFQPSRLVCDYTTGCGVTDYPAITTPEAECIRAESCAMLESTDVCGRAQDAQRPETVDPSAWPPRDAGSTPRETVCP